MYLCNSYHILFTNELHYCFDRSHAIFTVWIKVIYTDPGGHKHYRKGKLNLVDLAGSERHGKTGKVHNRLFQKYTKFKKSIFRP